MECVGSVLKRTKKKHNIEVAFLSGKKFHGYILNCLGLLYKVPRISTGRVILDFDAYLLITGFLAKSIYSTSHELVLARIYLALSCKILCYL